MKKDRNLKRKILIYSGLFIVVLILLYLAFLFYISGPEITVIGNSEIKAKPDLISILVIIQARENLSSIAQEKIIKISSNFISELENLGISREDIELSNYNVYEEFDWTSEGRKSLGFVASQFITVKLSQFNKTLQVINAATKTEALVSGISYELSMAKQNEYKAESLKKASEDARIKAESLARGFGKNLGKLVKVQSQEFSYIPYPIYYKSDVASTLENKNAENTLRNLSPVDLTVTSSISATYTITRF